MLSRRWLLLLLGCGARCIPVRLLHLLALLLRLRL
jgi:hypothetical protein